MLSDKDRRALLWGGPVVAVLLIYLLARSGGEGSAPAHRIGDAPPADMPVAAPAPIFAAPPVPVAPPMPSPAVPAADVSQLKLVGLLSSGALIAMPDGSQHFVPVGRELAPGVVLRRVELHQAVLATAAGEVRLSFDAGAPPASAAGVAQPLRAGMPPTP